MDTPMVRRTNEGLSQLYEDLPPELKSQYPRDEAFRYIENFSNMLQSTAQVCVHRSTRQSSAVPFT
jgi:hypothetical protein